jgi:hypothetical protein
MDEIIMVSSYYPWAVYQLHRLVTLIRRGR